jgi:STE24 endopeptidase
MDDTQIEAVFAHEMGHIVHRHLFWYLVLLLILVLGSLGPGVLVEDYLNRWHPGLAMGPVAVGIGAIMFLLTLALMSLLAHRFERQADVFAARMMESESADPWHARQLPVGPRGAQIMSATLHRVALVNNMSPTGWDLLHPSIRKRQRYLEELSRHPDRTGEFDRFMGKVYLLLLLALLTNAAIAAVMLSGGVARASGH